jgi:hypothetical protein
MFRMCNPEARKLLATFRAKVAKTDIAVIIELRADHRWLRAG